MIFLPLRQSGYFWIVNYQQLVNVVGSVIGFASFYFEVLTPFWGVVFLYGTFIGLKTGKITLFYESGKKESPLTYWSLILLWGLFGFYLLLYAFY